MNNAVGEASKRTVVRVGWIAVFILGLWVCSPSARTWYIEADGTGDAPTIQAGVDSAVVGDIVLVAAGTYAIDRHISMKNGITATSESGPYQTRVIPAPSAQPICAFACYSMNEGYSTEISGFWIEGFVVGPTWDGSAHGISLSECQTVYITNNVITGNGYGIWGTLSGDIHLQNNSIVGNDIGVYQIDGMQMSWWYNIIWDEMNTTFWGLYNDALDLTDADVPPANFSADPQFCGPSAGNYYLQSDSPCAPGNSPFPDTGLIGALPVGCATVKAESKTWGSIKDLYRE